MDSDESRFSYSMFNVLSSGVIVVSIALLAMLLRLSYLSSYYSHKGEVAQTEQKYEQAIDQYNWCVRQYYPGNPYVHEAIQDILAITEHYHTERRIHEERIALEQLLATLYSIRSFYQPYPEHVQTISRRLQTIPSTESI